MTTLAYAALWIFVFSMPWEGVVVLPGIGVLPRVTGGIALGFALLAIALTGRIRRWRAFHVAAFLFVLVTGCELFFLHDFEQLPNKYLTFVQLFLVLFMIWELSTSWRRQLGLLTAYVMGAHVAALATILVYRRAEGLMRRYAAGGFDPNDLAMTLALALPMAWYLQMTYRQPLLRWACRAYLPIGLVAIGLTGSRGGMLVSMVALSVVPLSMTRLSPGRIAAGIGALCLAGVMAVVYVPDKIVARLATTSTEVEDLNFGGRFRLWKAGLNAFAEQPVLGHGTSSFKQAITPQLGSGAQVAHNSIISVLVEEGLVGFFLYAWMFLAVFRMVLRLPKVERRFALVLMATLGVAMMPLTWEDRKPVWFILAALAGLSQAYLTAAGEAHRRRLASRPLVTRVRGEGRPVAPAVARGAELRPDTLA